MKKCTKCGVEKPLQEFYKRKAARFYSWCKPCARVHYAEKREFDKTNNPTPEQARAILNQELLKEGQKQCFECEIVKPLFEFGKVLRNKDGLQGVCRQCRKPRSTAANKKCREANPDKHRTTAYRAALKTNYGLTPEDKAALYLAQKGCCAICYQPFSESFNTHVDHVHESSPPLVRGLLCSRCNFGLGHFKDSPERLLSAVAYLKKFQK